MKKNINNNNTLVRLIVMIIVSINTICMLYGINLIPFSENEINAGISAVALVVSALWNHFKNNNYTDESKEAQELLNETKKLKKK